ncbi:MAG: hypothetical protein KatS3mg111_2924 [Pirellulaceae bacterium]|nr:MAG: hypothetical protein KatS3mg111_2924 [Pirellulaceae bacterium]
MLTEVKRLDGALKLTFDTGVSDLQDGAIARFTFAGEDRRSHPADVAYAERGKEARGRVQLDRRCWNGRRDELMVESMAIETFQIKCRSWYHLFVIRLQHFSIERDQFDTSTGTFDFG